MLHIRDSVFEKYYGDTKKVIPSIIFCFLYLILFAPPDMIPLNINRWYILLLVSIVIFIIGNYRLKYDSIKLINIFFGLHLIGAFIAIPNSFNFYISFIGFIGLIIMYVNHLLYVPLMSSIFFRKIFLFALTISALVWAYEIFSIKRSVLFLKYTTFGDLTGANKNFVSFLMAITSVACLHLAFSLKPSKIFLNKYLFISKLVLLLASFIIFTHQILIYSRSALITTVFGLINLSFILVYKLKNKVAFFRFASIALILFLSLVYIFRNAINTSPQIITMYNNLVYTSEEDLFIGRKFLINKAIYLISESPIIGQGIGSSKRRTKVGEYADESAHIHNAYLTEWIDKGILGLGAYIFWIITFYKFLFKNLGRLHFIDEAWLILINMTFFHLNFKDMNSFAFLMFIIFCGIKNCYDQLDFQNNMNIKNFKYC